MSVNAFLNKQPLFVLAVSAILSACSPAPDAMTVQGEPVYLKDHQDKTIVLTYWAEWCSLCKASISVFKEAMNQYPDLLILALNFDEKPAAEQAAFLASFELNYPALAAPIQALPHTTPSVIPTSYCFRKGDHQYIGMLQKPIENSWLEDCLAGF